MKWTKELASFVSKTGYDDFPAEVIQQTKLLMLDTLGCGLGGYTIAEEEVAWILNLVKNQGCEGPSTVFCDGSKTSSAYAALANAAMIHTVDFDDTHMGSVSHLGASLLGTIFAMGEQLNTTGKDLIGAFVLGFEVAARVGRSVMPSHYKFWHPTGTFGAFASAVAGAKLLRLNSHKTELVIGHAADQAAGLRYGVENGDFSKTLHPAFAAMKGVLLSLLVSMGADGPVGLLEYPSGFCNAYSESPNFEPIVADLGKTYEVMADSIKGFPTIQCSHTAIESILDIVNQHDLKRREIEKIEILQTETVKGQGCNYSPDTVLAARLSTPFCVALAVCERQVSLDQFTSEKLADENIKEIMPKVVIEADADFKVKYPETLAAFVDVTLKNGKTYSSSSIYPKGDPRNRMTVDDVEEKFRTLALNTFDKERVEQITATMRDLDSADTISDVTRLLVK